MQKTLLKIQQPNKILILEDAEFACAKGAHVNKRCLRYVQTRQCFSATLSVWLKKNARFAERFFMIYHFYHRGGVARHTDGFAHVSYKQTEF